MESIYNFKTKCDFIFSPSTSQWVPAPGFVCLFVCFVFVALSLSFVFFCFVQIGPVAPLHQSSLLPVIARFWPSLDTWGLKTSGKHFVWWGPMWNAVAELSRLDWKTLLSSPLPLGDWRELQHRLLVAQPHKTSPVLPCLLVGTVKPMIKNRTPSKTPHPTFSSWVGIKPPFLVNGRSKFGIRGCYRILWLCLPEQHGFTSSTWGGINWQRLYLPIS